MAGPTTEVLAGVGLLGRGFALLARRPRLFLLGALAVFAAVMWLLAVRRLRARLVL